MTRLLYIDDNPVDRRLAELLLDGHAEVTCAASGPEGLALLASGEYDLVVSDMLMPGMDGLDLAEAAAASGKGTPVILTSNCPSLTSFEDYTGLGNYLGFILKPVDAVKIRQLTHPGQPAEETP